MKILPGVSRRERGSALVIALAFSGLVFAVALSFEHSLRNQIHETGESVGGLHAELAAQSGIEYLRRQLAQDPVWAGMDEAMAPITLANGSDFRLTLQPGSFEAPEPTQGTYTVEGTNGDSRVLLEATVDAIPGDPCREKALVVGDEFRVDNVVITGDVLWTNATACRWFFTREDVGSYPPGQVHPMPMPLTYAELEKIGIGTKEIGSTGKYQITYDSEEFNETIVGREDDSTLALIDADNDGVHDLDGTVIEPLPSGSVGLVPFTSYNTEDEATAAAANWLFASGFDQLHMGAWVLTPPARNKSSSFVRLDLRGDILECAPEGLLDEEVTVNAAAHLPGWSLDNYFEPGPCLEHYYEVNDLNGLVTDNTVVIVNRRGNDLTLTDCELRGGLVFFAEWWYDPLSGDRNQILFEGTNVIGGLSNCGENIGLIAPGAKIKGSNSASTTITGVSIIQGADDFVALDIYGTLIVGAKFEAIRDSTITYVEEIATDVPDGVLFYGGEPVVDVLQVVERF